MKVDLLIVNYNTVDLLDRLLRTLASDYEPGVFNIHVADNGSPDGGLSYDFVDKLRFGYGDVPVSSVWLNENIGYSAAINQMSARSDADILCAVNADTWFTTAHVKAVIESFEQTPNMAVCGVKQIDESGIIRHGGIFYGPGIPNPVHRGWNEYDPNDIRYKDKTECWTVSGSIYYVRRSVWNEMTNYIPYKELFPEAPGAFLPTPMYFEETFCSVFAQHLGYEVWYDGTVPTAGHSWHASNPVGSNVHYFELSKRIYRDACFKMGIPNEFGDLKVYEG